MSDITIKEIHNPPNPKGAIILVHGWIGGNGTFGKIPQFLQDDYSQYQIYLSIVNTTLLNTTTQDISDNLCHQIISDNNIADHIIFITHSYGGSIVKTILTNKQFTKKIVCVIFIACPHQNFKLGFIFWVVELWFKFCKLHAYIISSITSKRSTQYLILSNIKQESTNLHIKYIETLYWNRSYNIYSTTDCLLPTRITNPSENGFQDRSLVTSGNGHIRICKPKTNKDTVYKKILSIMNDYVINDFDKLLMTQHYKGDANPLWNYNGSKRPYVLRNSNKSSLKIQTEQIFKDTIKDCLMNASRVNITICDKNISQLRQSLNPKQKASIFSQDFFITLFILREHMNTDNDNITRINIKHHQIDNPPFTIQNNNNIHYKTQQSECDCCVGNNARVVSIIGVKENNGKKYILSEEIFYNDENGTKKIEDMIYSLSRD